MKKQKAPTQYTGRVFIRLLLLAITNLRCIKLFRLGPTLFLESLKSSDVKTTVT